MATRPRTRKRVYAIRRAPDGSAFQKCGTCGVSVAIALVDMHDCEHKMENKTKRFKGTTSTIKRLSIQTFQDQPVSPYRLFMESFMKGCKENDLIEMDRKGFEMWKNMSEQEKHKFVYHARILDYKLDEALKKEADEMIKVDDEADSAEVGKVDKVQPSDAEKSQVDPSGHYLL